MQTILPKVFFCGACGCLLPADGLAKLCFQGMQNSFSLVPALCHLLSYSFRPSQSLPNLPTHTQNFILTCCGPLRPHLLPLARTNDRMYYCYPIYYFLFGAPWAGKHCLRARSVSGVLQPRFLVSGSLLPPHLSLHFRWSAGYLPGSIV